MFSAPSFIFFSLKRKKKEPWIYSFQAEQFASFLFSSQRNVPAHLLVTWQCWEVLLYPERLPCQHWFYSSICMYGAQMTQMFRPLILLPETNVAAYSTRVEKPWAPCCSDLQNWFFFFPLFFVLVIYFLSSPSLEWSRRCSLTLYFFPVCTHTHTHILTLHSALTLPPSIISTDLQVTDKAYNIRSKPPEPSISFLTFPPVPLPLFNSSYSLPIITCSSSCTFHALIWIV